MWRIYVYRAECWRGHVCEAVSICLGSSPRLGLGNPRKVSTLRVASLIPDAVVAAQELLESRQMPNCTKFTNSSFAILNLSGGSCRGRLATGGPLVLMWWKIPCTLFAGNRGSLVILE